ncbi:MAG: Tfp pilus assembly protein FimT/FimU [Betaproteobacteria bacterium]
MELLFALGLIVTMTAVAIPNTLGMLDEYRAAGAARYISGRLARVRAEAIARSADVGIRFDRTAEGYAYTTYVDGNGNGIRTVEIQSGIDAELLPAERLPEKFSGVDFGVLSELPAVDSGSAPPGTDPIHVGSSGTATFTPSGTASSGSLYIRGKGSTQWVVRIFGTTGRTRLLKFDPIRRRWSPS